MCSPAAEYCARASGFVLAFRYVKKKEYQNMELYKGSLTNLPSETCEGRKRREGYHYLF